MPDHPVGRPRCFAACERGLTSRQAHGNVGRWFRSGQQHRFSHPSIAMLVRLAIGVSLSILVAALPSQGGARLSLSFGTSPAAGKYAPNHVQAVWVESRRGEFVRTVARWGARHHHNLAQWDAAGGGDIDGMSGPTLLEHGRHGVTWDLRDRHGRIVPDGVYAIRLEMTDDNAKRNHYHRALLRFKKDGVARDWKAGSQGGFADIQLSYSIAPSAAPRVTSLRPGELSQRAAGLRGCVTDGGGEDPVATLYWGSEDGGKDPSRWERKAALGAVGEAPFAARVEGLKPGTTYFYRCHIENSVAAVWADSSVSFVPCAERVLIEEGAEWHYFEGKTFPGGDWHQPGFDHASWPHGPTGIGFGDDDDATVLKSMRKSYTTVYMRRAFELDDPGAVQKFEFDVDYDDGFVAFLNGAEIVRRNVAADQTHETSAAKSREAGKPETIDLFAQTSALRAGRNVLAIEVHNKGAASSDLSMIPVLRVWDGADG